MTPHRRRLRINARELDTRREPKAPPSFQPGSDPGSPLQRLRSRAKFQSAAGHLFALDRPNHSIYILLS